MLSCLPRHYSMPSCLPWHSYRFIRHMLPRDCPKLSWLDHANIRSDTIPCYLPMAVLTTLASVSSY